MSHFAEALNQWSRELKDVHLPRWEELPEFDLYLDQVLSYINERLQFLNIQEGYQKEVDPLLTAAMVNNYVKKGLIQKPEKKRYKRVHIACLMIYVLLKPVLSLTDIQQGIYLQVHSCKGSYGTAYNLFCRQFEKSLDYISRVASGEDVSKTFLLSMPIYLQGTYMATLSLASKMFSEKVLHLNPQTMNSHEMMDWINGGNHS